MAARSRRPHPGPTSAPGAYAAPVGGGAPATRPGVGPAPVDELFDVSADGSVVIRVRVQPGAAHDGLVGRHGDALKLRVRAPADRGRANDAVVDLVAALAGVPVRDVDLVGGRTSRSKRVRVRGLGVQELSERLARQLDGAGG